MYQTGVINLETGLEIEQALDFTQSLGLDQIEIHSAWGTHVEALEREELVKLREMVKARALHVSCISSTLFLRCFLDDQPEGAPEIRGFPAISGNYPQQMQALNQAFVAAEILQAPLVRVFGFHKQEPTPETFSAAAEKFRPPAEAARMAGITLVLENCPHTSFGWGVNAARLVQMVDSPAFRLLWDPAGAVRAGEPDCLQALPEIMSVMAHMHAKDILVLPDGGRQYLAPGRGDLPWGVILREILRQEYRGVISLEPHYTGPDGTKAGAVRESYEALQQITVAVRSSMEGK